MRSHNKRPTRLWTVGLINALAACADVAVCREDLIDVEEAMDHIV
jgi:hypothetical protein